MGIGRGGGGTGLRPRSLAKKEPLSWGLISEGLWDFSRAYRGQYGGYRGRDFSGSLFALEECFGDGEMLSRGCGFIVH
jgi:hypothetical protein